jgi:hypothetical protein
MIEGSGSGSVPLTDGSGSRRPTNIWILRIRNTGCSSFYIFFETYSKYIFASCILFTKSSLCSALEKSKFAKELADELDMVYVPPVSMEDYYVNYDGYDLRELDHKFHYLR